MSKILVIDDDPDFVLAMRMALEANGFEVESAMTPEEGISKTLTAEPALVLLDIMMPSDNEGFEVVRSIREQHNLKDLPIIVLTNVHKSRGTPYRFAPDQDYLPVQAFLDKSTDSDAVIDAIKQALGERREEPNYPL
jgi:CheY-like chemotaxis protein